MTTLYVVYILQYISEFIGIHRVAVAMHVWIDFVLTVSVSWFVFQEVENLSQQLSESKRALEEESEKVRELVMTNNSLKDLVTNTQEALDKEQNIVKSYTETSPNGKVWQWWQMCSDSQISFDFLWDLSLLFPRILVEDNWTIFRISRKLFSWTCLTGKGKESLITHFLGLLGLFKCHIFFNLKVLYS